MVSYKWAYKDHSVIIRSDGANITAQPGATGYADFLAWCAAGNVPPEPDDVPPTEWEYKAAIQNHVDQVARQKEYDDGKSCAGYATSSTFGAEAQAFIDWRDAVWVYAYQQLALVQAQQRSQPTIEELIDELPTITWPQV